MSYNPNPTIKTTAEELFEDGFIFNVTTNILSVGTNKEAEILMMKNPSNSGRAFLLKNIFIDLEEKNSDVHLRLYKGSTITDDGDGLSETNMNGASQVTAKMEWNKLPGASDFGDIVHTWILNKYGQAGRVIDMNFGWLIPPGAKILFTIESFKNKDIALSVVWGEMIIE